MTSQPQGRNLYLMAKPTPEPLRNVAALPRRCPRRPLELAHITLLPFADLTRQPPEFLPELIDRMQDFTADAFPVRFDRIREWNAVTLRFGKRMRSARRFQHGLVAFLQARNFCKFGKPPEPHLTISYHRDGLGDEAITPIAWIVEEVLLIESIYGKTTHVVHGRWPLTPLLI